MPMWICSTEGCHNPAVRIFGDCVICDRHLCSTHLQNTYHMCCSVQEGDNLREKNREADRQEIEHLMQKINIDALESQARSLRSDIPCVAQIPVIDDHDESFLMGGMNFHIRMRFQDGVVWIARIRRFNTASPPPGVRDHTTESEVATLRFLENTNVPTPKVRGYALERDDNPVGVGYILMDNMPGRVLDWATASKEERNRVIAQLADIYIELQQHPLDKLGCLNRPGERHIGALTRECRSDFVNAKMYTLGPFAYLKDYYTASIELLLSMVHRQEIHTDKPVEMYLIYRFLLDKVPEIYPTSHEQRGAFYLTHADDKGSHILVDENFTISGIIDWEWAGAMPDTLAFISPMLLLPVSDFFSGVNNIGEEEEQLAELLEQRGANGLAEIVRNGRLHHQIAFCCNPDLCISFEDLLGLFKGIRENLETNDRSDWQEWKKTALLCYTEDSRLHNVLQIAASKDKQTI